MNGILEILMMLKFCDSSTGAREEHFVRFMAIAETVRDYLTNTILQALKKIV